MVWAFNLTMRTCVRGSKGIAARAHFQRAIERGHLLSAETAARALPKPLTLSDALALLLLIAHEDPRRYSRAAARWLGRSSSSAGSAWRTRPLHSRRCPRSGCPAALEMLAELGNRYGVPNIEGVLRRFHAAGVK